ncbi:MAG: bifunctional riboflavin kinase/FAD synthetase [Bacteroides sp.]|nr:bifunctional riboflavin kinase/FAD synthetase [Roseburia sp.]MCM1347735.1 bifunctional riboflavin kinase/FAD synthetase [Bacteroides sp.]MCM1421582.1 bifunctional riboflavin kinase/FAD synthetase [Bacteroides sp.]
MKIIGKDIRCGSCVATIGFFDGVHCGHRFLIGRVAEEAHRRNLQSVLVTFANHPLTVVREGFRPQLITTLDEKERLLSATEADAAVVLDFTPELARLTARDFIFNILRDRLHVKVLVIGYDHRFGHNRNEGFEDYVRYGREAGIEVVRAEGLTDDNDMAVSSSLIRQCLQESDIEEANKLLGYKFFIEGTVVGGFRVGRKIGYPTANISVSSDEKLIPGNGVYVVRVTMKQEDGALDEESAAATSYLGMMNIGCRPTFANGNDRTIEVHLLDFSGNLYCHRLHIDFVAFVRKERKFDSVEQLQLQLEQDECFCRRFL